VGELLFDVESFGVKNCKIKFKLDTVANLCPPTYLE